MKTILLALALINSIFCISQTDEQWESIRSGNLPSVITLEIDDTKSPFSLLPNNTLSEEVKLQNTNLQSFDLLNTETGVKGKLTIDDEAVFIQIKNGGQITSLEYQTGDAAFSISKTSSKPTCGTKDSPSFYGTYKKQTSVATQKSADNLEYGLELRTYRLALIGTGEYTIENGGNAAAALTVATSTINGLNLIYESEASISLTLVASQFYTNENTDPFDPAGDSRVNQAAEAMAMNFSNGDYDIGHVFHYTAFGSPWAGGGLAGIGVACDNGTFFSTSGDSDGLTGPNKGAAWSGSFSNTGNSWLQLVAHEFGHQFGANHSFNGTGNSCTLAISSGNGYEIGSGTTLMSYNGLCTGAQNVPGSGEADNYFHSSSLDEIANFITSPFGNCSTNAATGNTPPEAHTNFMGAPIIPIGTPFELTGFGNDDDGDELSYQWEQIDEDGSGTSTQGFIGAAAASSTIAPLFRSFPPSSSRTRSFPELSEILDGNNQNLSFEALPQVTRNMDFSFIVRDGLGGVSSDGYQVTSSITAGPFEVTSQNSATVWIANGSNSTTITWDVANTDNATINCSEVDILLSTDNGANFDHVLVSNTPNDGSYSFQIPNLPTATGRIKIKASNNIFFDINDASIEIQSACQANGTTFAPDDFIMADVGDVILDLSLSPEYGSIIPNFSGTLNNGDVASSLAAESGGNCANFGLNTTFTDAYSFQVDVSGSYTFNKTSGAFGLVMTVYQDEFFPSSPCTNWLGSSFDNDISSIGNSLSVNLSAGIDYILVMGSFSATLPSLPATYAMGYTGPGNLIDGPLAPSGFNYNYVVVNLSTGNIMDVTSDPDLTGFNGGEFEVFGLSLLNSDDASVYINGPFSSLESDLITLSICGNLSSNSLEIDILGNACPEDLNNDGHITAGDLTLFLADFGCLIDCVADFNFDGIVTAGDLTIFLSVFGQSCN